MSAAKALRSALSSDLADERARSEALRSALSSDLADERARSEALERRLEQLEEQARSAGARPPEQRTMP